MVEDAEIIGRDEDGLPSYFCRVRHCDNVVWAPKSICGKHSDDWSDSPEYQGYCEHTQPPFEFEKNWKAKTYWNSWLSRASNDTFEEKFERLSEQWHEDTRFLSDLTRIIDHPAFQLILRMGQPVVPLMLKKLEAGFDHWVYALWDITGVTPTLSDEETTSEKVANWWVEWGKENGII